MVVLVRSRNEGFTLFELLISVALLMILAGIAMPSFRELSINNTVRTNVNELVQAITSARAEAARRGRAVSVVANGAWTDGWQVQVDNPLEVLSTRGPLADGFTITGAMTGGSGNNTTVTFGPSGALADGLGFDFNVCRPTAHADIAKSRRITVAAAGSTRTRANVTGSPAGPCS